MILTKEFLLSVDSCAEGIALGEQNNYFGMDYDEVIKDLLRKDYRNDAEGLLRWKKTEQYVRANGSVITMGAYQVFNPLTGLHTRYETEAEAKAALIDISKQILDYYKPQVVQELSNEKGDAVWIPTALHETLIIS